MLAQRAPSEGPRWTRAVREQTSLPSKGVETLRDLTHPLMGSNGILCPLDARSQEAASSPSKEWNMNRLGKWAVD